MPATPRLADVHCIPMRFEPGDRILVKLKFMADKEAIRKVHRTVQKWAGDHVEVLVIDPRMELEITSGKEERLAGCS